MASRIAGIVLLIAGIYTVLTNFGSWQESRASITPLTKQEMQNYESQQAQPAKIDTAASQEYEQGEEVATLIIPKIQQKFTVYWGTDENTLGKGVGMFASSLTTTPGQGHTVLSGHRDTVFAGLEQLETGDKLIVSYEEQPYTYIIEKIWITDEDDRTVIVEKKEPTLTLTTCYPFTYVGNAPDRYILQGKLL
ncbi:MULTISPECIES: class D sortase [Bacillaceae]|uniref:class D sortase n=1 Tax=Bacillaceae TaxID=186817 RepID=UPI001E38259D|nr:class D sortase [Bacillus sp. FJAT-27916]